MTHDVAPTKLLEIMNDVHKLAVLKIELATIVDVGEHFVKSTYNLERDGPLVIECYEEVLKLRAALQTAYHQKLDAVARVLAKGDQAVQQQ